jgi:hypothetical protein
VRKGLIGDLPLTTWVMDYPLFERSYYNLVVNFNVFGSVSHQAQTRLYFDLIRNGAEQNTLRYLPAELRQTVLANWYQNTGQLRLAISYESVDTDLPTNIPFDTSTPRIVSVLMYPPGNSMPTTRSVPFLHAVPPTCLR